MVPEPLREPGEPRQPRPQDDPPRIPGYEVGAVIGRGAAGTVYRARQLAVDREVALKVLHPELAGRERVVLRLQREARTTARLAHPHVVSAIDMGETDGRWWYAMELVEGPSLDQVLRQEGRLKEREALRLLIPLCEALEHLWEHGVVHRDIKPANILIDRTSGARLADLGLAFADDDPALTSQGGTLGTPHYISPEQAVDPRQADIQSDLWSFGATLYHALCGRPPFHGESTAEVLSAVLYAPVVDPLELEPGLSKGLALVLRKCLTRDTDERYRTPRELLLDLERVRERRAPKVRARSLEPLAGDEHRRRLATVVGAVAAVVLGLVFVWWLATRAGGEGAGGTNTAGNAAAPEPFEPLEQIADLHGESPDRYRQHLRELERMEARVPAAHQGRYRQVHASLTARLRTDVEGVLADVEADVRERAQRGDFVAARARIDASLGDDLTAATGFTLAELETRFGFLESRRAALGAELATGEELLAQTLAERLGTKRDELLAEARGLVDLARWASARTRLAVDRAALLDEVGYGGYRFSRGNVDGVVGEVVGDLQEERLAIGNAWNQVDRGLAREITSRAAGLAVLLRRDEVEDAGAVLRKAFDDALFERRIATDEMATGFSRLALDTLEREAAELVALEDGLREDRLRAEFELDLELEGPLWGARAYDQAIALWGDFAATLTAAPGDAERPWRREIADRVLLRLEEASLLYGLLERAATRVASLDGQERRMRVLSGGISATGRIESGPDPLAEGFRLVPEVGPPFELELTTLAAADLESLAGLARDDDALGPEDRLLRAAFRYHEGDLERAVRVLRSGDLPSAGPGADLAMDLRTRVTAEIEEVEGLREARSEEAKRLLGIANSEERRENTPDQVLLAIEKLLRDYGDVPSVTLLRDSLLDTQRRLEGRERGFEEVFGADRVVEVPGDRVRLGFDFDRPDVGAWERREWRFDGAGWSRPDVVGTWETLAERFGARLICRSPLDVETKDLDLTVRFELVDPTAPPQLLLVSAMGYHVALAGPGLPVEGGEAASRWLAGRGDLDAFLDRLRRGEGEEQPTLLRSGAVQTLRLRGSLRRGTLTVELDGQPLGTLTLPRRTTDQRSISLRSWEPIRLLSVELEGGRR